MILVVLSAVLLVISYPQTDWGPLAWLALVPFFFALDGKNARSAFSLGYACGFLFFAGTLGWFVYVTYPGAFLFIAYLSLYFAAFAVAFVFFRRLGLLARLFTLSAVWVALEFIRGHALSGFGWASLGHSQYKNYLLIQIADVTGVYGVSFLVILVNLLIFESLKLVHDIRQMRRTQIIVTLLVCLVLGYGIVDTTHTRAYGQVKVGVVQPNIPQALKWDPRLKGRIVERSILLTRALGVQKPDIIIWPETSLPGILGESPELFEEIRKTARDMRIPVLIGTIVQEGEEKYYNSAVLVSADGAMAGRYDKVHLVPFGEYLPLRPLLGFVNRFIGLADFTPGREYTLFSAGREQRKFGALICFEDTVPYLRRGFTNAGAQFLVNITNDAWFADTKAPFLHLQAAVFGAVENKRALVRAANTGVSAFIDPFGRVIGAVQNERGKKTYVAGTAVAALPLVNRRTVYTKYGDVFAMFCFLGILGAIWTTRTASKR
ncbi:MAG: apolipoprotein N-acyltransferase [Candidatus Omnitrophica bacterium]|nr:apolipoprotein N-acyltransferase [Candidatus Omnitrophota bacterium]